MTPTEYDALVARAVKAINDETTEKLLRAEGARLTIYETARAVVTALYGPHEAFFRFDDEAKELVEFKPKDEKAA